MAKTTHNNLSGTELHYSKIANITATPVSAPNYIGQSAYDTTSSLMYVAVNTATAADWHPVVGLGGLGSVVDSNATSYTITSTQNAIMLRLTNNAARAVTLPTGPINGFSVTIQDAYSTTGAANSGNITLTAGGSDIFQNGTNSFVITSNLSAFTFVYDVNLSTWVVKSTFIGFNPIVNSLNGESGSPLILQTLDTNSINLNVNSVNAASISTTNFEIKKILLVDDAADLTKQMNISLSGATTSTKSTLAFVQTSNRTLTFPDITDTIVSKNSTDILTNKSFNSDVTMLAQHSIFFNNATNNFSSSIQAGVNTSNLTWTLPIVAPSGGQLISSSDNVGTLVWVSASTYTQQDVATATNINSLASSTLEVRLIGSTSTSLNGINGGSAGKIVNVINVSTAQVTVSNQSGSASAADRISIPSSRNLMIPPGFTLQFQYDATQQRWIPISQLFSQIMSNPLGVSPTPGFIGNTIQTSSQALTITGANLWGALLNISLYTGTWLISGVLTAAANPNYDIFLHVGTTTSSSAVNPTDAVIGDNFIQMGNSSASLTNICATIPSWIRSISGSTIIYLNAQTSIASLACAGRLSAVLIG